MSGGSSGAISYPEYLEQEHRSLLTHAGDDTVLSSLVDVMNSLIGNSPFAGVTTYHPGNDLTFIQTAIANFLGQIEIMNHLTDYPDTMVMVAAALNANLQSSYLTDPLPVQVVDDTFVQDQVNNFNQIQTDILENDTINRFRAGMLNINAIQTSAYVYATAILYAFKDRDVAKFQSDLRMGLSEVATRTNGMLMINREDAKSKHFLQYNELVRLGTADALNTFTYKRTIWAETVRLTLEQRKLVILSHKEQIGEQLDIDEQDALWELELFKEAGNFIASISGGTSQRGRKVNKTSSAISGGLSGAAMGAQVGSTFSGYGAAIGAVAGAGLGAYLGYSQ